MRLREVGKEEVFRAEFRRAWERRFDQAAPVWAVELAVAVAVGEVMIVGQPGWAALKNIEEMVQRVKRSRDGEMA